MASYVFLYYKYMEHNQVLLSERMWTQSKSRHIMGNQNRSGYYHRRHTLHCVAVSIIVLALLSDSIPKSHAFFFPRSFFRKATPNPPPPPPPQQHPRGLGGNFGHEPLQGSGTNVQPSLRIVNRPPPPRNNDQNQQPGGPVPGAGFHVPKELCLACEKFPWMPVAGAENPSGGSASSPVSQTQTLSQHQSFTSVGQGSSPTKTIVISALGEAQGPIPVPPGPPSRRPFAIQFEGSQTGNQVNYIEQQKNNQINVPTANHQEQKPQPKPQPERPVTFQIYQAHPQKHQPTLLQPVPQQQPTHHPIGIQPPAVSQGEFQQAYGRPTILQPTNSGFHALQTQPSINYNAHANRPPAPPPNPLAVGTIIASQQNNAPIPEFQKIEQAKLVYQEHFTSGPSSAPPAPQNFKLPIISHPPPLQQDVKVPSNGGYVANNNVAPPKPVVPQQQNFGPPPQGLFLQMRPPVPFQVRMPRPSTNMKPPGPMIHYGQPIRIPSNIGPQRPSGQVYFPPPQAFLQLGPPQPTPNVVYGRPESNSLESGNRPQDERRPSPSGQIINIQPHVPQNQNLQPQNEPLRPNPVPVPIPVPTTINTGNSQQGPSIKEFARQKPNGRPDVPTFTQETGWEIIPSIQTDLTHLFAPEKGKQPSQTGEELPVPVPIPVPQSHPPKSPIFIVTGAQQEQEEQIKVQDVTYHEEGRKPTQNGASSTNNIVSESADQSNQVGDLATGAQLQNNQIIGENLQQQQQQQQQNIEQVHHPQPQQYQPQILRPRPFILGVPTGPSPQMVFRPRPQYEPLPPSIMTALNHAQHTSLLTHQYLSQSNVGQPIRENTLYVSPVLPTGAALQASQSAIAISGSNVQNSIQEAQEAYRQQQQQGIDPRIPNNKPGADPTGVNCQGPQGQWLVPITTHQRQQQQQQQIQNIQQQQQQSQNIQQQQQQSQNIQQQQLQTQNIQQQQLQSQNIQQQQQQSQNIQQQQYQQESEDIPQQHQQRENVEQQSQDQSEDIQEEPQTDNVQPQQTVQDEVSIVDEPEVTGQSAPESELSQSVDTSNDETTGGDYRSTPLAPEPTAASFESPSSTVSTSQGGIRGSITVEDNGNKGSYVIYYPRPVSKSPVYWVQPSRTLSQGVVRLSPQVSQVSPSIASTLVSWSRPRVVVANQFRTPEPQPPTQNPVQESRAEESYEKEETSGSEEQQLSGSGQEYDEQIPFGQKIGATRNNKGQTPYDIISVGGSDDEAQSLEEGNSNYHSGDIENSEPTGADDASQFTSASNQDTTGNSDENAFNNDNNPLSNEKTNEQQDLQQENNLQSVQETKDLNHSENDDADDERDDFGFRPQSTFRKPISTTVIHSPGASSFQSLKLPNFKPQRVIVHDFTTNAANAVTGPSGSAGESQPILESSESQQTVSSEKAPNSWKVSNKIKAPKLVENEDDEDSGFRSSESVNGPQGLSIQEVISNGPITTADCSTATHSSHLLGLSSVTSPRTSEIPSSGKAREISIPLGARFPGGRPSLFSGSRRPSFSPPIITTSARSIVPTTTASSAQTEQETVTKKERYYGQSPSGFAASIPVPVYRRPIISYNAPDTQSREESSGINSDTVAYIRPQANIILSSEDIYKNSEVKEQSSPTDRENGFKGIDSSTRLPSPVESETINSGDEIMSTERSSSFSVSVVDDKGGSFVSTRNEDERPGSIESNDLQQVDVRSPSKVNIVHVTSVPVAFDTEPTTTTLPVVPSSESPSSTTTLPSPANTSTKIVKTVRVRQRMRSGSFNGPLRTRFHGSGRVRVVHRPANQEYIRHFPEFASQDGDRLAKDEEQEVKNALIELKKSTDLSRTH
ncbi:unnamed protein product [Orchesella dallaii]|uniref:Uncharacterized protein n=1 Tax=Orchesella dallaii TaxID=48710 RepID=A0ABP1R3P9_9HEXA